MILSFLAIFDLERHGGVRLGVNGLQSDAHKVFFFGAYSRDNSTVFISSTKFTNNVFSFIEDWSCPSSAGNFVELCCGIHTNGVDIPVLPNMAITIFKWTT